MCVDTKIDFIFWCGGVVLVGLGGFFGDFLGCVVYVYAPTCTRLGDRARARMRLSARVCACVM